MSMNRAPAIHRDSGYQRDWHGSQRPGVSRFCRKPRAFFVIVFAMFACCSFAEAQSVDIGKNCEYKANQSPEMVVIDSGVFKMGAQKKEPSSDSIGRPQHEVTIIEPFALGRCEVTVAEFRIFVEQTGYATDAETGKGCYVWDAIAPTGRYDKEFNWRNPGFRQQSNEPVACVSRNDAQAYMQWLSARSGQNYRLPSEAEWEYAARADTTSAYPWGDTVTHEYANYGADNCCAGLAEGADQWVNTAPVGSFPENKFGLLDMQGNVREWVQDCWHENYQGAPINGSVWQGDQKGDCSRAVVRGGGWNFEPISLRSDYRFRYATDEALNNVGFRLARTL